MTISSQATFTVCELNAENLFDCTREGTEDVTFLPQSGRHWSYTRYWKKLDLLSKALISMGRNGPPDIICIEEVENDSVMRDLTQRAILRRAGYRYVITHGNDIRGINVALLYQPETFKLLLKEHVTPKNKKGKPIKTRDILHIKGRLTNGEGLHLFVCHFSSKAGGSSATDNRIQEAVTLNHAKENVLKKEPYAKIVIIGDFNEDLSSKDLKTSIGYSFCTDKDIPTPSHLYNISSRKSAFHSKITGTYKYGGYWDVIDQCIITGNLLLDKGLHTSPRSFEIWDPGFLLDNDVKETGLRPRRTYDGYLYRGGLSDHLPVRITFLY